MREIKYNNKMREGDYVVVLDEVKGTWIGYEAPLNELRDSL